MLDILLKVVDLNDDRGRHITSLVEEYTKWLALLGPKINSLMIEIMLIQEGVNHYQSLRETLSRMIVLVGYNAYFESMGNLY